MAWVDGMSLRDQCDQMKDKYNSKKKGGELLASLFKNDLMKEQESTAIVRVPEMRRNMKEWADSVAQRT